ncbi:LolA family protein [Phnomibacter sp. MR]|uniref:LolA family protein n=1 Tax=Phnomibacter sp. MR TaxID=3042318 RepID=UPI003A806065
MKIRYRLLVTVVLIASSWVASAQDATALILKLKAKLEKVNDYSATGRLRTDVAFLKVPVAKVNVYFKKPNRFRISKEKGISILPKGGVSVNMQNVLNDKNFVALDAGTATVQGQTVKVVKVLPADNNSDVVLTTLYIDETNLLIKKSTTTTKENGTYDVELFYGKWIAYALPDKTVFSFNTKDYKLPKGVTLEFDDGEKPNANKLKNKKGYVELTYDNYIINKGVPESFFTSK